MTLIVLKADQASLDSTNSVAAANYDRPSNLPEIRIRKHRLLSNLVSTAVVYIASWSVHALSRWIARWTLS